VNCTVPVGELPLTDAVNVTLPPAYTGFADAVVVVVVGVDGGGDDDTTRMYPDAVFVLVPPGPLTVNPTEYVPAAEYT